MLDMRPDRLSKLVAFGPIESHCAGEVFYSLDFKEELYIVKTGYVKRYSVMADKQKVIESIYGPGYFFPLTSVYSALLHFNLSQEINTYVYQAMTDVEIQGISSEKLLSAVTDDPSLYKDLFYEAGVRLRANVNRLSSNAFKNDYQKVTHQLAYLAEEFGVLDECGVKPVQRIPLPLEPIEIAEQLNISEETAIQAFQKLQAHDIITIENSYILITDINLLKDAYL